MCLFLYCYFLLQAFGCTKNSTHCSMIVSTVSTRGRGWVCCVTRWVPEQLRTADTKEGGYRLKRRGRGGRSNQWRRSASMLRTAEGPSWLSIAILSSCIWCHIFNSVLSVGISCSQDRLPINDWFTSFCLLRLFSLELEFNANMFHSLGGEDGGDPTVPEKSINFIPHVIKSPTIYKTNFTNVFPNTLGSDDSTPRPSFPPSDTTLLWCPQKSGMPE